MAVIKGVLREELKNSEKMFKGFSAALAKLPVGSIMRKKRRGRAYCYLQYRKNGRVVQEYKGRLKPEEVKRYDEAKVLRKKYRHSLSVLKKQIKYLRGVLRGKEPI